MFKIAAAFFGGLVVALGGAMVYVHTTDGMRTQALAGSIPAVQQRPVSPKVQVTRAPMPADEEEPPMASSSAADAAQPAAKTAAEAPVRHKAVKPIVHYAVATRPRIEPRIKPRIEPPDIPASEGTSSVVEISQSIPPQLPPVVPQTDPPRTPAVNENSNPIAPEAAPQAQNQMPAPEQPHVVTLTAGTALDIRLGETLSTEHNYSGDTFRATLLSPIIMDGFIIAERGSKALGRVVFARRARRIEGISNMSLALTEINTTDGQRVGIETDVFDRRGPSNALVEAAKIGGGAALGAIIGAISGGGKGAAMGAGVGGAAGTGAVLFSRGRPAVVAAETVLQFRLTSPVTIIEQLNH